MALQDGHQRKLGRLRRRLERWRAQHGGPGRLIPDELWAEAAIIARELGVEAVARALRVDRSRLAERTGDGARTPTDHEVGEAAQFVEVDTRGLFTTTKTIVRFEAPDGERLEVEVGDRTGLDVAALAEAFWSRTRSR
jgi:hypothetical protein